MRPEFGHCTNAITIVGRARMEPRPVSRPSRTSRILRSTEDETPTKRSRPVSSRLWSPCAPGINLEYYFSNVDNVRFGCARSYLNVQASPGVQGRTRRQRSRGQACPAVEIHEPVRLLFASRRPSDAADHGSQSKALASLPQWLILWL